MVGRKDPVHLSCSFTLKSGVRCPGSVGAFEAGTPVSVEAILGYHPLDSELLTRCRDPGREQREVGSLTGAVAS